MRLSDCLQAERGNGGDVGNIISNVAAAIRQAECFELSDDVVRAAYNLTRSKPTTLLSALPLVRAPYRKIWLEWRGGRTSDMVRPELKRDPTFAPDPIRQGCLIETDESGRRGFMTFAWVHKERPERMGNPLYSSVNVCPLGTLFNWEEGADVHKDAGAELRRRYPTTKDHATPVGMLDTALTVRYARNLSDEQVKVWMQRSAFHDWGRAALQRHEREALQELGRHAMPMVSPHGLGFFGWCADQILTDDSKTRDFLRNIVTESWEKDIEGEPPFAETIIAMMNSRNCVEHRSIDLSKINKARAKHRKLPFLEYRTTHLRLSQAQTRALRAGLLSREEAGRHSVRGHFKIRKSGVYWWNPFFRGDPTKPIHRQEYTVI